MCAPGTSASISPESSFGQEEEDKSGKEIKWEEIEKLEGKTSVERGRSKRIHEWSKNQYKICQKGML